MNTDTVNQIDLITGDPPGTALRELVEMGWIVLGDKVNPPWNAPTAQANPINLEPLDALAAAAGTTPGVSAPTDWWPGMFGLEGNVSYYGQSESYTGRPSGGGGGEPVVPTTTGYLNRGQMNLNVASG